MKVYLELHEYGRIYGRTITLADVPAMLHIHAAFAEFKDEPRFVLCMQNEPNALQGGLFAIAQAWVTAVRDAGWRQTICIPSPYYSGLPQISDSQDTRAKLPGVRSARTGAEDALDEQ